MTSEEHVPRRVIWVDPDPSTREKLERRVRDVPSSSARFHFVETGGEALIECGEYRPHIVVLDSRVVDIERIVIVKALVGHGLKRKRLTKNFWIDDEPSPPSIAWVLGVITFLTRADNPLDVVLRLIREDAAGAG